MPQTSRLPAHRGQVLQFPAHQRCHAQNALANAAWLLCNAALWALLAGHNSSQLSACYECVAQTCSVNLDVPSLHKRKMPNPGQSQE